MTYDHLAMYRREVKEGDGQRTNGFGDICARCDLAGRKSTGDRQPTGSLSLLMFLLMTTITTLCVPHRQQRLAELRSVTPCGELDAFRWYEQAWNGGKLVASEGTPNFKETSKLVIGSVSAPGSTVGEGESGNIGCMREYA